MREERDSTPVEQLELDFDLLIAAPEVSPSKQSNVVHVQFGIQKAAAQRDALKDRALVERILQSAQRLKW